MYSPKYLSKHMKLSYHKTSLKQAYRTLKTRDILKKKNYLNQKKKPWKIKWKRKKIIKNNCIRLLWLFQWTLEAYTSEHLWCSSVFLLHHWVINLYLSIYLFPHVKPVWSKKIIYFCEMNDCRRFVATSKWPFFCNFCVCVDNLLIFENPLLAQFVYGRGEGWGFYGKSYTVSHNPRTLQLWR